MDLAAAAVAENVEWCTLVCRLHGVATTVEGGLWTTTAPPPPYYPATITLHPSLPAATVESRARPGTAVKDSYADLRFGAGFTELFAAAWIAHPRAGGDPGDWLVVEGADALAEWRAVHGSADALVPALLEEADVAVLARRREGALVAGAVVHRTDTVTGVSNVFGADAWSGLAAAAADRFGPRPLVGYEHGAALAAAQRAGFERVGELRVWLRAG